MTPTEMDFHLKRGRQARAEAFAAGARAIGRSLRRAAARLRSPAVAPVRRVQGCN